MGYVDLHHHLLYGVDDGAKTVEDSLVQARTLVKLGFTDVAPSPHARPEYPSGSIELCESRRAELQARLSQEQIALTLHANAENVLDPGLLDQSPRRLLGKGPYLLAEAPYLSPLPGLPELIFRLKLKGVTLLVAHPERCREFERPGRAAEVVRQGALLQLDVGALTNRYGKTAKKLARAFLDEGLYAVAATDLHSPTDAERWVGDAMHELDKVGGRGALARLFGDNPGKLLRGEPID